jgi:hypothetical protein
VGIGNLSGQGVGGEEQVGCGGDMSGFAMGEGEFTPDDFKVDSPDDERATGIIERNESDDQRASRNDALGDCNGAADAALAAGDNDSRQGAIRDALFCIHGMDTGAAKSAAMGALGDALAGGTGDAANPQGVPQDAEVEDMLDRLFSDEIAADASEDNMPRAFNSRSRNSRCNWWSAAWAFFQSGATYGNWCGKGAPNECGSNTGRTGYGGKSVCADSGLDSTCSKHDSGSYSQDVWGFATLNWCEVDRNFKSERSAAGVLGGHSFGGITDQAAANGANCLFGVLPCLRYESYSYWGWCSKWWGGYPCRKSTTGINTKWPYGNYPSGGCQGSCYK